MFQLKKTQGAARSGLLTTRRGVVPTPCFMPIATKGGVKAISVEDLKLLNPSVILGNTYHLMLRPGEEEIKKLGGLHQFMNWSGPILTDSGGFQVFSLAKIRKIDLEGAIFNSHLDGREWKMSPEDSIRIQMAIGSDIMMAFDECVALPAERKYIEKSVDLTTLWAKRCKEYFEKISETSKTSATSETSQFLLPLLFGIVQGGLEKDLRQKSAAAIKAIGFDGYAIGGLSVGEKEEDMCAVLDYTCAELPADQPRYLMGVGSPHQILEAVKRGIDLFDCVIPSREARHGRLYFWKDKNISWESKADFYDTINVAAEKYKFDLTPINADSRIPELRENTKAYLRHLFTVEDPTAQRLATLNNLEFYIELMARVRRLF